MNRHRLLVLTVGISLVAVGCGGSDGASTDAAREIPLATSDMLRFEPASVTAKAGEKVTFVITNPGSIAHEFTIGSASYLAGHSGGGGGHGGGDDGGTVKVPAGATARLTFTMPKDAPSYACHVDRHDQAGMVGTVTYA